MYIETKLKKNIIIKKYKNIIIIFGIGETKTPVRVQDQGDKMYKIVQYYKKNSWQDCSEDIFIQASVINKPEAPPPPSAQNVQIPPPVGFTSNLRF